MKMLAHDIVNDVAMFRTDHGGVPRYYVRYGLETTSPLATLGDARSEFAECQQHALAAEGYFDEEDYD